ncbi:kinase-like protein [Aaosphaeria arxii CBS 175.79]|uniref:Kinase-like protein n=1 Tax=Aaosphaeria arxii CBS 175.79 TaxID=1450172 RepID=A0A6A5Y0X7_9PLEO|nr:kinase-like protein [Aaosphaeria arxii CBS 175.79]KAF2018717.1 kinase-like protein [Aaosphaeria arxii CBS 175.79]
MGLPPLTNRVHGIQYGVGADCVFTMVCNNKYFEVSLSADSKAGTLERGYLDRIEANLDEASELDVIFEELGDIIAIKCQPWCRKFAGDLNAPKVLSDIVRPPVAFLRLATVDGELQVVQDDSSKRCTNRAFHGLSVDDFSDIPIYKLSEISLLEVLKTDAVFKVDVRRTTMCAKVAMRQSLCPPIRREINTLRRIQERRVQENTPADHHRIPSLIGLIVSENGVLGFLMEYIETVPPVSSLAWCKRESVTMRERKKWYCQVRDTLNWIHSMSLVWGDIKAENVLIDEEGNAWIIDFGGSYTDGWVDQHLVEKEEGDLQGLERLMKFLELQ